MKLTWIYFGAAALLSFAAALLLYRHAQLRLRVLGNEIQIRANLIASLRNEHDRLSELSGKQGEPQRSDPELTKVLKLRGEIGVLWRTLQELTAASNTQDFSRSEFLTCKNEMLKNRVNRLRQLFEERSAKPVPEFQYMSSRDWADLLELEPEIDRTNVLAVSMLRSGAQIRFAMGVLEDALHSYAANNNGLFPAAISDLQGYFKAPVEETVLENWTIVRTSSLPDSMRVDEDWVITQKAPVDPEMDQRIVVGLNQTRLGQLRAGDWAISR